MIVSPMITVVMPVVLLRSRFTGFMPVVVISAITIFVMPPVVVPDFSTAFGTRGFHYHRRFFVHTRFTGSGICGLGTKQYNGT
jgi:hypothetical protein